MTPVISKPNLRAIMVASGVFAFLYFLSSFGLSAFINWWFSPMPPDDLPQRIVQSSIWAMFSFSLYLIPGFISGLIAGRSGLMHGLIVGAFSAPIMAVILYVAGFGGAVQAGSILYGLGSGLFWCSLSGVFGELVALRVRKS